METGRLSSVLPHRYDRQSSSVRILASANVYSVFKASMALLISHSDLESIEVNSLAIRRVGDGYHLHLGQ